ncbi:hypothetical protein [Parasitella parasitica]|uniref:Extracellular membrane protein CFEM domain-containing protein n=1 Tax=Parasitella parasitica TaxID=35722 RepID=A0A0B7NT20_9FUNG|nr:hypothetical protein [Parasitella parasitica]
MKFTFVALVSSIAFSQLVSAQVAACAAQQVLSTCLSNEETYLKTCQGQDYACLCKWHAAKLSCYDNCPNDPGMPFAKGEKDTFCSIAQTYNTTTSSSSVAPSVAASTTIPSNSASVALPSSSSSTTASSSSTSNHHYIGQGLMVMAGVTAYFLI